MRTRLSVQVGDRDQFKDVMRAASSEGVETIDPLFSGKGPAMSQIDSRSKRSLDYTVCTGLAVLGKQHDGTAISFVTHQVPTWREETMRLYDEKIRLRLQEFVAQSMQGSIDAALFGGEHVEIDANDPQAARTESKNDAYHAMKDMLASAVRETLGVELRVVDQPNAPGGHADMFLDTKNATLYIEHW